jgi:hypothetical protein
VADASEGFLYFVTSAGVDIAGLPLAFHTLIMAYLLHIVAYKLSIPFKKAHKKRP